MSYNTNIRNTPIYNNMWKFCYCFRKDSVQSLCVPIIVSYGISLIMRSFNDCLLIVVTAIFAIFALRPWHSLTLLAEFSYPDKQLCMQNTNSFWKMEFLRTFWHLAFQHFTFSALFEELSQRIKSMITLEHWTNIRCCVMYQYSQI